MISLEMAQRLKAAGLEWHPQYGDVCILPQGGKDHALKVTRANRPTIQQLEKAGVVVFAPRLDQMMAEIYRRDYLWKLRSDGTINEESAARMLLWLLEKPGGRMMVHEDLKAKHDCGKARLSLVPTQIIRDIAAVREFGNKKYHDPENWRTVQSWRYRDALFRHLLAYLDDPAGIDRESGLKHLAHVACNVAFLCELEKEDDNES